MTERARTAWVWMYCSRDRQARVAFFRLSGEEWQLATVGAAEKTDGAGGGFPLTGRFGFAPGYPGCPGCGGDAYVRCGACGHLGCWRSAETMFTCGNCEYTGRVSGTIDSLGALDVG